MARSSLAFALMLALTPLQATGHDELRAALEALQGRETIKATAELYLWKQKVDGGVSVITQGEGTVFAEDGPGGTVLRVSPQILPQIAQEGMRKMKTPDAPTPRADCLDELGPRRVGEYLNYTEAVLRDLEQCTFAAEEATTRKGQALRLLRYNATPSLPTNIRKLLDKVDAEVKVWIQPDGRPAAAEIRYTYKGSRLFIGFTGTHTERIEFTVVGKRLVVTEHDWDETFQGFGQTSHTHKLYKIAIKNG